MIIAKTDILCELGHDRLLKPTLIERALVANEQAKYYLTLLQNARAHAEEPGAHVAELRRERIAAGVDDAALDGVVASASKLSENTYRIASAADLLARILAAVETMIAPVEDDEAAAFRRRLATHADLAAPGDVLTGEDIDALTSADRTGGDSLHLLVMDVHKALNRQQAAIASETVDGAHVYSLSDEGKSSVRAFMAGVNRTAPLKFGHPGLATTATEWGGRLVLQNDLGTTDAHVLVVAVENLSVSITYTDIHLRRLAFFRDLFASFNVEWSASERHTAKQFESGGFALTLGVYRARDGEELRRFLEFLGSRLVFLIDWNKARKKLRPFVDKRAALDILAWAAGNDLGHRGFIEIGGEGAVYEAMEFVAAGRLHFGDRLDDILGPENATSYLRFVLQAAAQGLRAGRTPALIKDEIKIELRRYFETGHRRLISIAFRHASYIKEIAGALHAFLVRWPSDATAVDAADRLAERAARWESEADALLNQARAEVRLAHQSATMLGCLDAADDAADALEEGAFLLMLLVRNGGAMRPFAGLAELLDDDARALVTALECAAHLDSAGPREDLDEFLAAVQRIFDIEHAADNALRLTTMAMVADAVGVRELFLGAKLAEALEEASDRLAHSAQILKTYALEEVMRT